MKWLLSLATVFFVLQAAGLSLIQAPDASAVAASGPLASLRQPTTEPVVATKEAPPSYTRVIKPFMETYCVECHRPGRVKGKVDLSTYEAMFKGGKKGRIPIVPGKPDQSSVQRTMEGHRPIMPPRKEKLQPSKKDIATVRAWIAAGAKNDTASPDSKPKVNPPVE
jgi:hypothetical protein